MICYRLLISVNETIACIGHAPRVGETIRLTRRTVDANSVRLFVVESIIYELWEGPEGKAFESYEVEQLDMGPIVSVRPQ